MFKRGVTLTKFVLVIGIIIIGSVLYIFLNKIILWQARSAEQDVFLEVSNSIKENIRKAEVYPSDTVSELNMPDFTYKLKTEQNRITFNAGKKFSGKTYFYTTLNVVSSEIENSKKAYVIKKGNQIYISDKKECNIGDGKCDLYCVTEDKCDPDCLIPEAKDNFCMYTCLSNNDGICDPDCYSNIKDNFYDKDCVKEDNICDPDTPSEKDGICDKDCFIKNNICDPDCKIYGIDEDCPPCPNSRFEPDRGENCLTCPADTKIKANQKCYLGCKEYITKPSSFNKTTGLVDIKELREEGEKCLSDCDCKYGYCSHNKKIKKSACCPIGKEWNGRRCVKKFVIVVVPLNYYNINEYKKIAQEHLSLFKNVTPFGKECKRLETIILAKQFFCTNPESFLCSVKILKKLKNLGINFDVVVAFTPHVRDSPFSNPTMPYILSSETVFNVKVKEPNVKAITAHELGHQLGLCDEYDKLIWMQQNNYEKCGNPYPLKTGIGPPEDCTKDCSVNESACKEGSCGKKIKGNKPLYETNIMGGGATWSRKDNEIKAITKEFDKTSYKALLRKIIKGGYCD